MYRRNKYFDLIICCGCGLFLLFWYYSRRDISNKLVTKEEEKKEAIAYMNSLKEELKIVFQHTQSLEVLLRNERFSHQLRQKELHYKSRFDQVNISQVIDRFENDFKKKTLLLKSYNESNIELKSRHLELLHRSVRVHDDFRTLSHKSMSDIQSLRQAAEMAALSLRDRIEDLESQKKYYQKQSVQYDFDNKKSKNKLSHCYKVLALVDPLRGKRKRKDTKSNKKMKREKSKQNLSKTQVAQLTIENDRKAMKSNIESKRILDNGQILEKNQAPVTSENPETHHALNFDKSKGEKVSPLSAKDILVIPKADVIKQYPVGKQSVLPQHLDIKKMTRSNEEDMDSDDNEIRESSFRKSNELEESNA